MIAAPLTFEDCLYQAAANEDLVFHFNRLTGRNFGRSLRTAPRSPIDAMVDQATGYKGVEEDEADIQAFADFVLEYVWLPLLDLPPQP